MAKHILKGHALSRRVKLDGKILNPIDSQKVVNHSPDGFSWGYGGSGPSQLALAVCLELYENDSKKALQVYRDFKTAHILPLDQAKDFEIEFEFPV